MANRAPTQTVRTLLLAAVRQVRRRWRALAVLQVVFKLASLLLLTPLAAGLLNMLIARGGAPAVGNLEIVGFALSLPGLLALVLLPTVTLAIFYLEQSTTLALLRETPTATRIGLISAVRQTLVRLPGLTGVALIQVTTAVVVAVPFLALAGLTYWLLLSEADINYYLAARPPRFYVAIGIGAVLGLGLAGALAWIYVRWFFALPLCLLEGLGPRAALAASVDLTHGRRRFVLQAVVAWVIARTIAFALLAAGLTGVTWLVLWWSAGGLTSAIWATGALLFLNTASLAVASSVDRLTYATLLKQLYRAARRTAHPPTQRRVAQHTEESRRWPARRSLLAIVALTAAVVIAAGYAASSAVEMARRQEVVVTAHRAGAMLGPENSLGALERSIAAGADWAEIDVQLSADGTLWVVHDRDLRRVAGSPLVVAEATDQQLRTVQLHGGDLPDEPLATLEQFINAARGRIGLSIELKYYGFDPRLAEAVVALVRREQMAEAVTVISLEYEALEQVRRLAPEIRLGYLLTAGLGDVTQLEVDFLSVNKAQFDRSLDRRAAERGLDVAVWTTNASDEMLRLMARGADDLVTDAPATARAAVEVFEALTEVELVLLRLREITGR